MISPSVSVVMSVYNAEKTVAAAIRSILAQSLQAWELVVIDDASTDRSVARISELADTRIRIVRNERNVGLAESLNRGVAAAVGKYIARMDADDVCFPERLARQYDYITTHPAVDLVGAGMLVFEGAGNAIGVLRPPEAHQEICAAGIRGLFPLYHPTWMARAEWCRAHPYDPAYRKAQDYELLLRAAGVSTYANVPEILLGYRREVGQLGKRLRTRSFVLRALHKNLSGRANRRHLIRGVWLTGLKTLGDLLSAAPGGNMLVPRRLPAPEPAETAAWVKLRARD